MPVSSGPSVTNSLPSALQSMAPPTPGNERRMRAEATPRCSASSASGSTGSSLPPGRVHGSQGQQDAALRVVERCWRRRRRPARGPRRCAARGPPRWRWSSATRPPTRATTSATPMPTSCSRSRRLVRRLAADQRRPARPARHRPGSLLASTNSSSSGRQAVRLPATSSCGLRARDPRSRADGSRPSSVQVAADSRIRPSTISSLRSSSIHCRSRGHSRTSASWATSTVGSSCLWVDVEGEESRGGPAVDDLPPSPAATSREARRRVGSPSAATTTRRSKSSRTSPRSCVVERQVELPRPATRSPLDPAQRTVGGERQRRRPGCARRARRGRTAAPATRRARSRERRPARRPGRARRCRSARRAGSTMAASISAGSIAGMVTVASWTSDPKGWTASGRS